MLTRLLVGAIIALAIALTALRRDALSPSGAVAAVMLGSVASAAGWPWAALLIAFFVVTSALPHLISAQSTDSRAATDSIIEKSGARDATQVFANGGVFAALAFVATSGSPSHFAISAAGALAAAAADSWSTEFGTRWGTAPRSILTWMPVAAGTSGGVTIQGLIASVAGAAFVAGLASTIANTPFGCVLIAGVAGGLIDSLVGASIQTRRWCGRCGMATERKIHTCGSATRVNGGLGWMNNDAVNVLCTVTGAILAGVCAGL